MRARVTILAVLATVCAVSPSRAQTQAPAQPAPEVAELACSPRPPRSPAVNPIRVLGALEAPTRRMMIPGERLVVSGGSREGLQEGRTYFVRRLHRRLFADEMRTAALLTAGWVEVEQVQETTATARIVWACDGILAGDELEPFEAPTPTPVAARAGHPVMNATGVVLVGSDGRITGGPGDRMLVDLTTAPNMAPGERVHFFRRVYATAETAGPATPVGEGHVLEARSGTAVVRIDEAVLPVRAGDRVAAVR